MSPQKPCAEREDGDDSDGHTGVVKSLAGHGVRCWQTEDDRNEADLTNVSLGRQDDQKNFYIPTCKQSRQLDAKTSSD